MKFGFAIAALLAALAAAAQEPISPGDFTQPGIPLVRDSQTSVSLSLPSGWRFSGGIRWGDHQTTIRFEDQQSQAVTSLYYQVPIEPFTDAAAKLEASINGKVRERLREGCTGYHVREGSRQTGIIGGHPTISFLADYTQNGEAMVEYTLRVLSAKTEALFFVRLRANSDITSYITRLMPLAQSLTMQ